MIERDSKNEMLKIKLIRLRLITLNIIAFFKNMERDLKEIESDLRFAKIAQEVLEANEPTTSLEEVMDKYGIKHD